VDSVVNTSGTWEQTHDAYQACLAKYPGLRGAFVFHDGTMATRNWDWVHGLGATIRARSLTG
jgi:hypothetical protein